MTASAAEGRHLRTSARIDPQVGEVSEVLPGVVHGAAVGFDQLDPDRRGRPVGHPVSHGAGEQADAAVEVDDRRRLARSSASHTG